MRGWNTAGQAVTPQDGGCKDLRQRRSTETVFSGWNLFGGGAGLGTKLCGERLRPDHASVAADKSRNFRVGLRLHVVEQSRANPFRVLGVDLAQQRSHINTV